MLQGIKEVLTEELQENAGKDPLQDRFRVGYITAVNDFLRVHFEEITIQEETE